MMIRDAHGHPIALPLAKLPSVPLAADVDDLRRHLRTAPDPLTAQALLRRYVDDNITAHARRAALNAALDTAGTEFPHFAHEVAVTRQIYNLPPFDIARRTRANVRSKYPACGCVKCADKLGLRVTNPAPSEASEARSVAARSVSSTSSEGSVHTSFSVSWSDEDDPPPPYSAVG